MLYAEYKVEDEIAAIKEEMQEEIEAIKKEVREEVVTDTYARISKLLHLTQFRNVCLKILFGVLSGTKKHRAGHGTFCPCHPIKHYWAYISAINDKSSACLTCT